MSSHVDLRDLAALVSDLRTRVGALERHFNTGGGGGSSVSPAVFDLVGPVEAATSDPDVSPYRRVYRKLGAGLKTAGSSSTVFRILVDGVAVESGLTLSASDDEISESIAVSVPALSQLEVEVTSAGTGANGLTVRLEG